MFGKYFRQLLFSQFLVLYYSSSSANSLPGTNVKPATEDEFPFIVSLCHKREEIKKEHLICGGALISKKHVLTAAHCIAKRLPKDVVVIAGNINIELGKSYEIQSWITHYDWVFRKIILTKYNDNDIAIIELSQEVKDIKPGIISKSKYDEVIGKEVMTTGWGLIDENARLLPKSLQKAPLKVLTSSEYEEIVKEQPIKIKPLPNNYHTSRRQNAILSEGDSGGPLLLNGEIVGVNESSGVVDSDGFDLISYHVVVDYYRDFIKDVTKTCLFRRISDWYRKKC